MEVVQRVIQPKRHLQVAAAPVKKKKHRRKPAVMQGVYPCIFLVAITAAFILFCQMQLTQLTAEASEQSDLLSEQIFPLLPLPAPRQPTIFCPLSMMARLARSA